MTTPINLSVFMQALSAAGLASVAVSFGSDGTVTFGPDVTAAQKIAVEALLAQHNPVTAGLLTYASAARFNLETGGITINGMFFPTDRQTQAQLSGAATAALNNASFSTMWKLPTGQFVQLGAPAIIAAAQTVAAHVAACFAMEANIAAQILAVTPSITTTNQIDAAFAGVSP